MTGIALFVLAVLQVLDICLTARILRAGGRELNGIVATIIGAVGNAWGAVKYGIGTAAAIMAVATGNGWVLWPLIAIMAGVVDHNLAVLYRQKGGRSR